MPTYLYKNLETGDIYELKQSMRDDAYTHHPETGAAVKRIVSRPAIAFKGSGFYANDSRSGGRSAAAPKSEGGEGGASGSKGETGGAAKPESSASAPATPAPAPKAGE